MWTFTTDGFFSVVAHQKKHTHLMVRARDKESLENLSYKLSRTTDVLPVYNGEHKFMNQDDANEYWLDKIKSTPLADYPFRMTMLRETWAQYMTLYTENHNHINKSERKADLQYTNFKNACKDAGFDEAKLIAMHRVWETMAYDWNDLRQYLVSIDHPDD